MVLKPIQEIQTEIKKILIKEFDNVELKRLLNKRFVEKGFTPKTITLLFEEKKFIEELDEMQTICISKAMYEYFSSNERLNPKRYFSDLSLNMYKSYMVVTEEVDKILIKDIIEVNNEEYIGIISYKDVYKYINNNLFVYTLSCQRQPTFRKIGENYVATPTIDDKAVYDIEQTVLRGELESTMVVLTLLIDDGHIPKINFTSKMDNIGDLLVDETLSISDGAHRLLGIASGVAKHLSLTGEYLEGYISVKILIADSSKARRVVTQSFKRATTSKDYLKAITENDVTIFSDKVINQSKLKGHISDTFEECKAMKTYTYRTIMIDILNKCDISYNNKSEVLIKSKKFGEYIDIIIDFMGEFKLIPNLYAMLLYCAYKIDRNNYDGIEIYYKIGEAIEDISEQQIKDWKLEYKTVKLNLVIQYFDNIFKEEQ